MMWSPAHDLAIGLVTLLHWPLAAVGEGRGYDRGEPSGAAVAAARRAGSPWPEQMDRKMLRFVEKRGVRTDKTKRLQRGQKCCQRIDLRFHHLSKCTVIGDQPRNPPKSTEKRIRINFPFPCLSRGQLPPVGWGRSVVTHLYRTSWHDRCVCYDDET